MNNYILNIETATKACSVALFKNENLIVFKEHASQEYSHSETLSNYISNIIEEAGIAFSDLTAVAVSMGPGSYTGLRIGVSTAKGLCYALNIPLISISTLQAMALGISKEAIRCFLPNDRCKKDGGLQRFMIPQIILLEMCKLM